MTETLKNEELICRVARLGANGEGVTELPDGKVMFVPFVCEGEEVTVRVLAVKKKFAYGKCVGVGKASPDRVMPKCAVFGKCGGCQLQHLRYEAQLLWKQRNVRDTLKKVGGIETVVAETVPSVLPYGYRNKIQVPVGIDRQGRTVIGFYRSDSHDIVPIETCPLHGDWAAKLMAAVRLYMEQARLSGYDETTKKGDVRHIVARKIGERIQICIVTPLSKLPKAELLTSILQEKFSDFALFYNVNARDTNVILGDKTVRVYGEERLNADWQGIHIRLAVQSFLQVNTEAAQRLYDGVIAAAKLNKSDIVIDAYSGAGILSARLARSAYHAYGVEICKEASLDADVLKKENGVENLTNINGDCAQALPALVKEIQRVRSCSGAERNQTDTAAELPTRDETRQHFIGQSKDSLFLKNIGDKNVVAENKTNRQSERRIVVVLDPPRKGCDERVLAAVAEAAPSTIVYVSCNPATLARDLKYLTEHSFSIESVTPYDLFPQTCHVETLVILTRKE